MSARPSECPIAYFRSACASPIKNRTVGFSGPGQLSVTKGFPFTFSGWVKEGNGYYAGHSAEILQNADGYAYSRNTGGYLTGVDGTYVYAAGGDLADRDNNQVRIHMYVPDYGDNEDRVLARPTCAAPWDPSWVCARTLYGPSPSPPGR